MKIITTKVNCRGCNAQATIQLEIPSLFKASNVPFKCPKCASRLVAEVKRDWFKQRIHTRVKMIEHTQTLLNILKRRGLSA